MAYAERKRISGSVMAYVLARQGNCCYYCGKSFKYVPPQFHHKNGNRSDSRHENIVAVCPDCHSRHHIGFVSMNRNATVDRSRGQNPFKAIIGSKRR